jgi:hypothetical protein
MTLYSGALFVDGVAKKLDHESGITFMLVLTTSGSISAANISELELRMRLFHVLVNAVLLSWEARCTDKRRKL